MSGPNNYTPGINEVLRLALSNDKAFRNEKSGQLDENLELSGVVELQGVEPWSGEGIDCVFYMFIGDLLSGKNQFTNYQPLP